MSRQSPSFAKKVMPLFLLFIIINSAVLIFEQRLYYIKVDPFVVFTANCLLFVLSVLTLVLHIRAFNKSNPNVFVRSVMLSTMIKLFVLAAAALVYLFMAGSKRSVYGVFASMLLYIVYMFIEIRIALKLNQKR